MKKGTSCTATHTHAPVQSGCQMHPVEPSACQRCHPCAWSGAHRSHHPHQGPAYITAHVRLISDLQFVRPHHPLQAHSKACVGLMSDLQLISHIIYARHTTKHAWTIAVLCMVTVYHSHETPATFAHFYAASNWQNDFNVKEQ